MTSLPLKTSLPLAWRTNEEGVEAESFQIQSKSRLPLAAAEARPACPAFASSATSVSSKTWTNLFLDPCFAKSCHTTQQC